MANTLDISIPTTITSATSTPYTLYNITIRQPLRNLNLQKRYSDFTALHASITTQASNTAPPTPLPAKSWFKKTVNSLELTEDRRKGLEAYLRAINTAPDPRWRTTEAWTKFLNLYSASANGKPSAPGAGPASRQADLYQSRIVDPLVWMDVHRDLQSQLSESRQALRRRTEASTAAAQHEAAAEVKRNLVRSGMTITALEEGLKETAEISKAPKKGKGEKDDEAYGSRLAEGEIMRRRSLLSAAKKERDALEMQLMTLATKGTSSETMAAPQQKEALLRGPASSNPTNPSRRVIGGPVRETERTRELDNTGVLQLQQQILHEQDEDVGELTKAVQRMKTMGVTINEELEYQIKMLQILEQDVDRNADKIAVAKKKIAAIK